MNMNDFDSVIMYSIFPNVPGMFQALSDFAVYNNVAVTYFGLLGIAIGISFLTNVFDTKF